jgi:hypothetical protein
VGLVISNIKSELLVLFGVWGIQARPLHVRTWLDVGVFVAMGFPCRPTTVTELATPPMSPKRATVPRVEVVAGFVEAGITT